MAGLTKIRGKELLIKQTPVNVYSAFADLKRFSAGIPNEYRESVTIETDSIIANIKGFNLGVCIDRRVPFSLISFKEYGQSPFPFNFDLHFDMVGLDSTLFHIELSAELNTFMKMMVGGRLQEFVDKLTDQIEKVLG